MVSLSQCFRSAEGERTFEDQKLSAFAHWKRARMFSWVRSVPSRSRISRISLAHCTKFGGLALGLIAEIPAQIFWAMPMSASSKRGFEDEEEDKT